MQLMERREKAMEMEASSGGQALSRDRLKIQVHLQKNFAMAFSVFSLAVFGVPLAIQVGRQGELCEPRGGSRGGDVVLLSDDYRELDGGQSCAPAGPLDLVAKYHLSVDWLLAPVASGTALGIGFVG